MAKGKGKKKNDEPAEPPHQQIWEQVIMHMPLAVVTFLA